MSNSMECVEMTAGETPYRAIKNHFGCIDIHVDDSNKNDVYVNICTKEVREERGEMRTWHIATSRWRVFDDDRFSLIGKNLMKPLRAGGFIRFRKVW